MNAVIVNSRGYKETANHKNKGTEITEKVKNAVSELSDIMSDGQWYSNRFIGDFCRDRKVKKDCVLYQLNLAISDDELFYCLPNEKTPIEPTGEN